MKKVVSIAVFGDADRYAQYLSAFVRAHLNLFPISDGWRLCVHIDDNVAKCRHGEFIRRLGAAGLVDAEQMGSAALTKAMLWRMKPVFSDADYVFCRDLDACPMPRDRAVCDQFIVSQATVHTVHDNLAHAGIMGGLCGFRVAAFQRETGLRALDDLYRFANIGDDIWRLHGTDQNVLNRLICRPGGPIVLEHRFAGWTNGSPTGYRRSPGIYDGQQAYSAPTPDVGVSKLQGELARKADRLAAHMGAAGYDHLAAQQFYDEHGDPAVAEAVRVCEAPK